MTFLLELTRATQGTYQAYSPLGHESLASLPKIVHYFPR